MRAFNVIVYDFNHKKFIPYDVIPYFVQAYNDLKEKKYKKVPETFEEFKEFVRSKGMYQFWARCEYEVILVDWPGQKVEKKIDVWNQIEMNLDIVTKIVMDSINGS